FQIATRMTSWIAIDEVRRVTGPTRDQLIPQELPYGTSASAFGLRTPAGTPPSGMRTQAGMVAPEAMDQLALGSNAYAPRSVDEEEGDFGEEAPQEIFGE